MAGTDTSNDLIAVRNEVAELRENLRRLGLELAEMRSFFRETTADLSQQVKEAKAAALLREGGVPTPPRLQQQR